MKARLRFLFVLIAVSMFTLANATESITLNKPALKATYNEPATNWTAQNEETTYITTPQPLPLGNGYMGSMVFGGVELDLIQVNEHTLWSGGPGANVSYDGGHKGTAEQNKQNLQNVRRALQDKMTEFTATKSAYIDDSGKVISNDYPTENAQLKSHIEGLMGDKSNFGAYQSLGNINIAYSSAAKPEMLSDKNETNYTNYSRTLDLDNATVTVKYDENGVTYIREYFMSYPKNVMVIKLSANQAGKLTRAFWISTPQTNVAITAENNTLTMTGRPADHTENGLKFAQQIKIIPTNGTISAEGNRIIVENADEILLFMSAATNYMQCMDDTFNYFSDENPLDKVAANIKNASQETYEDLLKEHISDYKSLYDRMALSFNNVTVPVKATNQLLAGYKDGTNTASENLYLEMLYYQFGRYLLIASSRENTLPANLQGVWADGLRPPWASDYHTNINLQMNYWAAQQTNLSSCHIPMIKYVKSLVPRGKQTAQRYYCKQDGSDVRGWVIHHENNTWGNTAPGNWYEGFYFPAAAAWVCQDIWEYYQFNSDENFLKEHYNTLLDAALFWVDNLWTDERDGSLVANPSYSPEHGSYSLGASCDQAIIWELFDFVIKAGEILDDTSSEMQEIKSAKSKLAGPQIGLAGQFMEWKDEITKDITGDGGHRHVNHLFWLHPGSQIVAGRSAQENDYIEAMKKTLNTRGDGGTGWSKAWKINFWARLRDGDRSHKLVEEILKQSTLYNLFDTHPPFQIDGNFGSTAGMTEMLLQSQGDYIEILPALPQVWNAGNFKGIKARGNFEMNARWQNGCLSTLEIISNAGNECILKYENIKDFNIREQSGGFVEINVINNDKVSFQTEKGKTYVVFNSTF